MAIVNEIPKCLRCDSDFVYNDGNIFICAECSFEFTGDDKTSAGFIIKDANGVVLQDGDSISIIKDLKLKGSAGVLKVGTKVKNIRLVDKGHNIDCRIAGFGKMALKSEFVKKI